MCDTFVALGTATKDGNVIFGKNSDRMIKEVQLITYAPSKSYPPGESLKCTYVEIPQVTETFAVILSQPSWIWGAEMGANEHSVVIGNEAIATKEPLKESGLLGMDILRLGLERGKTAKDALDIMTDLIENPGQGGPHHPGGGNYHNSFIIADPSEAYILEAAGEWWIVEKVSDFRSISNDISIRGKGDSRREGIIEHAINKGYCKDDNDFDFATTFSTPDNYPSYMECSMGQLSRNKREITPAKMMSFLREHEGNICRHKRKDFTTSAQVSLLRKNPKQSIHWFTGGPLTCLSIFKPYIFPIVNQRVLEAKIYPEIDDTWYWKKCIDFIKPYIINPTKEKPERSEYQKKLRDIEQELTREVNNLLIESDELSDEEFLKQIENLNKISWDRSIEMVK